MYTALFLLSELIYSYSLYKILGTLSGNCRIGKTGETACYLAYGLLTGGIYLLWNIPILTLLSNLVCLFLLSMLYEGKMSIWESLLKRRALFRIIPATKT